MNYANALEINKAANYYAQCFDMMAAENMHRGAMAGHAAEIKKVASAEATRQYELYKVAASHPDFISKMSYFYGVSPEAVVANIESNLAKMAAFFEYTPQEQQYGMGKFAHTYNELFELAYRKQALQDSAPIDMASLVDANLAPSQWNQAAGFVPGVGESLDVPDVDQVAMLADPVSTMSATMDNDDVANAAQAEVDAQTVAKAAAVDAYLNQIVDGYEKQAFLTKVAAEIKGVKSRRSGGPTNNARQNTVEKYNRITDKENISPASISGSVNSVSPADARRMQNVTGTHDIAQAGEHVVNNSLSPKDLRMAGAAEEAANKAKLIRNLGIGGAAITGLGALGYGGYKALGY